jgi:hypothetical protein
MSNLPSGAENDSRAPWNEYDNLCRYCDEDILYAHIRKEVEQDPDCKEDCIDEQTELILSEYPLCKQCAKEEYYDYDEDEL